MLRGAKNRRLEVGWVGKREKIYANLDLFDLSINFCTDKNTSLLSFSEDHFRLAKLMSKLKLSNSVTISFLISLYE